MQVFISHSSQDKPTARKVAEQLRLRGCTIWIDEGELKPGDRFAEKIDSAISQIDVLVVILTNNSLSSNWVKHEINQFIPILVDKKKKIIPLLFDNVELPTELGSFLYGDCRIGQNVNLSINTVFASITNTPIITRSELDQRLKLRITPRFCIRILSSMEFHKDSMLGKVERKYVSVGDYDENYGKSLREVMGNLFQGIYLEKLLGADHRWIAVIFEVGELYRIACDLLPATWKAVFRILTDKRRKLTLFEATKQDFEELGESPRDYYEGNQKFWYEKIKNNLGEFPYNEQQLIDLFGIYSMCLRGDGLGPNGHRLFFVKNQKVEHLNFSVQEMGKLDDGIILK